MSQIYKCDRCGNTFDIFSFNDNHTYSINYWGHNPNNSGKTHIDLCNNCAKEFDRFLKGQACSSVIPPVSKEPICDLSKKPRVYYFNRRTTDDFNISYIAFNTHADAEMVYYKMKNKICQYNSVSIGNMFDFVGLDCPHGYMDYKYGWTKLDDVNIIETRDGWVIDLPPARNIFQSINIKEGDTDGDKYFE